MTRQQTADWNDGAAAFSVGTPYSGCPHSRGERRIQWQEGWMQTQADSQCETLFVPISR